MRILCVIDNLGPGGAQRQLVELALGFHEMEHDVSFLTYSDNPFYNSVLDKAGLKRTCIDENGILKRIIKMRRLIRRGNYDAILSFMEAANFCCECAGLPFRKWKLIVGERIADPNISRSLKLRIFRWFHVFADYIVSNSRANIAIVQKVNPFISKKKYKVIHNIVDFNKWYPLKSFQFKPNGTIRLVIAGSHIYRKNLLGLIESLALLAEEELDRLKVAWHGDRLAEPYYDGSLSEARRKLKALHLEKTISLFPAKHNIHQIIQNADVVGLFSFSEGLPNVMCEGMACGKPVICSDISDVSEILSFDKNLLFNPSDPISIKESIRYLLTLNSSQLSEIGMQNFYRAKKLFDGKKIIRDYLQLFENEKPVF